MRTGVVFPKTMSIPFPAAMHREVILYYLKTAVEILIEGDQERIERVIGNPNDAVGAFVKQIWEAIKDNPA